MSSPSYGLWVLLALALAATVFVSSSKLQHVPRSAVPMIYTVPH
jgi:hypothetical protein